MSILINILAAFLGFAFITVTRMQSLKSDAENANLVFSYSKYFQKDLLGIASSFLSIFIWIIIFPEVSAKYPALLGLINCSFVAFGAIGSYILQKGLSKTKGWIDCVIDEKTNIADGINK